MTGFFLITGLPRSRTAWLATVANTVPGALCHHEPMAECGSWQGAAKLWRHRPCYSHVGISDSGMGLHLGRIVQDVQPRVLIVERGLGAVENSLAAALPDLPRTNFCRLLADRLARFKTHPLVKVIPYGELRSSGAVGECLEHLMPGAAVDRLKIALLMNMNVQTDLGRAMRTAAERAPDAARFLGADIAASLRVV